MSIVRDTRRALGKAWLNAFGWKIEGGPPPVDRAVMVAAPHTSNWDLPFMLAVAWALDVDVQWVGKHTLFELPVAGQVMRALGGIPVDRRGHHDAVKAIASTIRQHEKLLLAVPPEGTRSAATRWKTGFYWIAVEAQVPIVLGFLDFGRKRAGVGEVLYPTGDIAADFAQLRHFYTGIRGLYPELQGEIALGPQEPKKSNGQAD